MDFQIVCKDCGAKVRNTWKGKFRHIVIEHPEQVGIVLARAAATDPYAVGQGLGEYVKNRLMSREENAEPGRTDTLPTE
jgi:hypothetical protein